MTDIFKVDLPWRHLYQTYQTANYGEIARIFGDRARSLTGRKRKKARQRAEPISGVVRVEDPKGRVVWSAIDHGVIIKSESERVEPWWFQEWKDGLMADRDMFPRGYKAIHGPTKRLSPKAATAFLAELEAPSKGKRAGGMQEVGEFIERGLKKPRAPRKETESYMKGKQPDIFAGMRKHMQHGPGGYVRGEDPTLDNPKKKAAKKRAATPEWQRVIRRCQRLWDHYCERPGKKRLQDVFKHLETMKASTSKKVADERKRCLRAANAEAKRLKLKR